jgi:hypothetical protein
MKLLTGKAARIILAVILSLLILSPVQAQAGLSSIYVNRLTSVEGDGPGGFKGVSMTWDFVMLNDKGQVIPDAEVESAQITLQDGDSRDAQVILPTTPWSIVILVDASVNMANAGSAFNDSLQALASSLDQLPDGSSIAILKFDEEPSTVTKFTEKKETLQKALQGGIPPSKNTKKSCLNNAAYEAINMLSGASSRRALLVLTASTDNCEERQASEVVKYAQDNSIQIYAVGLEGLPVSKNDLDKLAVPTGGLSAIKRPDVVDFAFGSIFGPLKNQWQAKATTYPTAAGKQTAKLTVVLKDQSSLTSDLKEFTSPRVYNPPPEIKLRGDVLPTFEGVTFNLDISSQALIQKLDIYVDNKASGNREYSQVDVKIPADVQPFKVNLVIPKLVQGDKYTLSIQAVDKNGGQLQPVVQDFTYQPSGQVLVNIEPYKKDQAEITVHLDSANLGDIGKYEAWLVSQCNNLDEIPGTKLEVATGDPYVIKTGSLSTGKYHVVAQAIDKSNQVVLTYCEEQAISFVKPGLWPSLINGLRQSPLAIVGVTFLALAGTLVLVVAIFIWQRRSSRPKPVPVRFPVVKVNAPPPNMDLSDRGREIREVQRPVERPAERPAPPPPPVTPPPANLPPARLSGTLPTGAFISTQIGKETFTIGRAAESDLMVRVDKSIGVSREHATIKFISGSFYIEDNGSTYGTKVNNQPVPKGSRMRLEDNAIIELGPQVKIKFNNKGV